MFDIGKVQPCGEPIVKQRCYEMEILKEQVFTNKDQVNGGQLILQWNELLPFIADEMDSEESCPILTF